MRLTKWCSRNLIKIQILCMIILSNCVQGKLEKSEKQTIENNLKVLKKDFDNVLKNAEDFTTDFFGQILERSQNAIDRTYADDFNWDSSEDSNDIVKSRSEVPKSKPAINRKKRSVEPNQQYQNAYDNNGGEYFHNLPQITPNEYNINRNEPSRSNGNQDDSFSSVRNTEIQDECNEKTQREYELEKKKLAELKSEVKQLNDVLLLIKDQHKILQKFNQTKPLNIEFPRRINTDTLDKVVPTHKEIDKIKLELSAAVKTINQTSKILEMEKMKENNLEIELKKQQEEIYFLKIMISHLFIKANDKNKAVDNISNHTNSKAEPRDTVDEAPLLGSVHHTPKSLLTRPSNQTTNEDDRVREASPKLRSSDSDNGDLAKLLKLLAQNKKEEKGSKSNEDDLKSKLEELEKQMKEKREQEQLIERIKALNSAKPQSKSENSADTIQKLIAALNKPQSKSDDVEVDLKQLQAAIRKLRPIEQNIDFGNSVGGKDESQDFQSSLSQLINQGSGDLGGLSTMSTAAAIGPSGTSNKITPQDIMKMYQAMKQQNAGNPYSFYGIPPENPSASLYTPYQQSSNNAYPTADDKMSPYSFNNNYNNMLNLRGYGYSTQPGNKYNYVEPSTPSGESTLNYGDLINSLLSSGGAYPPNTYYSKLDKSYNSNPYYPSHSSYPANYNGYDKTQIFKDQHVYPSSLANQQSYMGSNEIAHPGSPKNYSPKPSSYPNQYQQPSEYMPQQNTVTPANYKKVQSIPGNPQPNYNNGKQFFPNMHDGAGVYEGNAASSEYGHQTAAPASVDQSQYSTPNADNKYQLVTDLKNQIDGLENVIKSLNTGEEYGQKAEDRQTINTLEQRINDLKGVINSLNQPPPYSANMASTQVPVPSNSVYGQPAGRTYSQHPAPSSSVYNQPAGGTYSQAMPINNNKQPPRGIPSRGTYNGAQTAGPAPPPAPVAVPSPPPQNTPYKSRKRRQAVFQPTDSFGSQVTDVNREHLNLGFFSQPTADNQKSLDPIEFQSNMVRKYNVQPTENQFTSAEKRSSGQFASPYLNNQMNPAPAPDALSQISALFQRFVDENVTRASQQNEQNYLEELQAKLDDLKLELERKSEPRAYNEYPNYSGVSQNPILYNKISSIQNILDAKKKHVQTLNQDIFTTLITQILDKIINSLPNVLSRIFGSFTSKLVNDKGYYGPLQQVASNMGAIGFLPMIILKIIDSFSTIFNSLKKNSFFKQFLLPGIVFLLVGGSILFLIWFLQADSANRGSSPSYALPKYQNQNQYGSAYPDQQYAGRSHYLDYTHP